MNGSKTHVRPDLCWLGMGLRFVIGCFCIGGIFGIFRMFQALSKKESNLWVDCIFFFVRGTKISSRDA